VPPHPRGADHPASHDPDPRQRPPRRSRTSACSLAQNRHERAFEAIIKRYRTPCAGTSAACSPEAAEDTLQQASINAWTSLAAAPHHDLRPWLYRVAHNASIDVLRTGKYDLEELSESLSALGSTEEDVERRAVIRETLASVAALPDSQREALLRTAIEGDPRADIARDLGVTEGAVRQLVHRARTTLRAAATAITRCR
jgi:RNA polymerase sigma factor (sigma-70 family)